MLHLPMLARSDWFVARNHPEGVKGYLCDKEKRSSEELPLLVKTGIYALMTEVLVFSVMLLVFP
jgi:hypothetical protein